MQEQRAANTQSSGHQNLVKYWARLQYSPIDNAAAIRSQLNLAHVQFSTDVTAEMHQKLLDDTTEQFEMYQSSTPGVEFEQYIAKRSPAKLLIDLGELRQTAAKNDVPSASQPAFLIGSLYNQITDKKQFAGLCGVASTIDYSEYRKASMPLKGLVDTEDEKNTNLPDNVGYVRPNKMFGFSEDFDTLYNAGEPVKVAQVTTLVQGSGTARQEGRMIIRFAWCPKAGEWRPFEIAMDHDLSDVEVMLP